MPRQNDFFSHPFILEPCYQTITNFPFNQKKIVQFFKFKYRLVVTTLEQFNKRKSKKKKQVKKKLNNPK